LCRTWLVRALVNALRANHILSKHIYLALCHGLQGLDELHLGLFIGSFLNIVHCLPDKCLDSLQQNNMSLLTTKHSKHSKQLPWLLTCFSCDLLLASNKMCSLSCCQSPASKRTSRIALQHILVLVMSSASLDCFSKLSKLSTASLDLPCIEHNFIFVAACDNSVKMRPG